MPTTPSLTELTPREQQIAEEASRQAAKHLSRILVRVLVPIVLLVFGGMTAGWLAVEHESGERTKALKREGERRDVAIQASRYRATLQSCRDTTRRNRETKRALRRLNGASSGQSPAERRRAIQGTELLLDRIAPPINDCVAYARGHTRAAVTGNTKPTSSLLPDPEPQERAPSTTRRLASGSRRGAKGDTGDTGAKGDTGQRGPGPSDEQVDAAVARYCSTNVCGRPPTAQQVATAVLECANRGQCRGPMGAAGAAGEAGRAPTSDEVAGAVAEYCRARGFCMGLPGRNGQDGKDGRDGRDGADAAPIVQFTITVDGVLYVCTDPEGDRSYGCLPQEPPAP
jgi:hypothetical protein